MDRLPRAEDTLLARARSQRRAHPLPAGGDRAASLVRNVSVPSDGTSLLDVVSLYTSPQLLWLQFSLSLQEV